MTSLGILRLRFRLIMIQVGPLPPSKSTTIQPLEYCFNADRNYVHHPLPDQEALQQWTFSLAISMIDVLDELLEGVRYAIPTNTLFYSNHFSQKIDLEDPIGSLGAVDSIARHGNGTLSIWMQVYRPAVKNDAHSLMPQGLYIKIGTSHLSSISHLFTGVQRRQAEMQQTGKRYKSFITDGSTTPSKT